MTASRHARALLWLLLVAVSQSGCGTTHRADPALRRVAPVVREAWQRARRALSRGHPAEAVGWLREVTRLSPRFVKGHLLYQDAMLVTGRAGQVVDEYRAGLRQETGLAHVLYARVAPDEKRIFHLKRAMALDPDLAWARYALGFELAAINDQEQARLYLEEATKLDPELGEAYFALALLHKRELRFAAAAAAFETYVKLCPLDVVGWFKLGACRQELDDRAGARAAYERVLALDPGAVRAAIRRRDVALAEEQVDKGGWMRLASAAGSRQGGRPPEVHRQRAPVRYMALVNLAGMLLEQERAEHLGRVPILGHLPVVGNWFQWPRWRRSAGYLERAVRLLRQAVDEDRDLCDAYFNLGIAYERWDEVARGLGGAVGPRGTNFRERAHEAYQSYLDHGGDQRERVRAWIKALTEKDPDPLARRTS